MSKKILVVGSLAYDNLMEFEGAFKDSIIMEKLDNLNLAFTTTSKKVFLGGCAGNIAHTLKLLDLEPFILTSSGKDFSEYMDSLKARGINTSGVVLNKDLYTAAAYILTDKSQNQIITFYIGAMGHDSSDLSLNKIGKDFAFAIISPDNGERMIRLAKECYDAKIPYIFDPGQQIGNLTQENLKNAISGAEILIVNEYEESLLFHKLGTDFYKLVSHYLKTLGEKGVFGISNGKSFEIPAFKPIRILNPTGCGDAFRAGLLYGLNQKLSLQEACKLGALAGVYNIEHEGTQEHHFTLEEFNKRLLKN